MELLLFSDLHRDLTAADRLVEESAGVDVVVGAGDFATMRRGLQEVIDALAPINKPLVVVPGNAEDASELIRACAGHDHFHVLHGTQVEAGGIVFFGLGGAVPVTPFGDWSFDLTESEASELLADFPPGAVLVSHSPPYGHCDTDSAGAHLGSRSVLECVEEKRPGLVVCGHIHAAWGQRSTVGSTEVINAGPASTRWSL